jgi:hypothetical protein
LQNLPSRSDSIPRCTLICFPPPPAEKLPRLDPLTIPMVTVFPNAAAIRDHFHRRVG